MVLRVHLTFIVVLWQYRMYIHACVRVCVSAAEFDVELVTSDELSKRAEFSTAQFFELQSELSRRNEVRSAVL